MPNGKIRYGASQATCLRCGNSAQTHEIKGCDITNASIKGIEAILAAVRALRGNDIEDRMIGALMATTTTKVIKLVAVSGPGSLRGVHGWEAANVAVPRDRHGWTDIYGRVFTLPAEVEPGNPCAAIKMLIKLGELMNAASTKYRYKSIALYEEAVRATVEVLDRKGRPKLKKSTKLQVYHGQDRDYVMAAHSCQSCNERLPLLLCSGNTVDVWNHEYKQFNRS